MPMQTTFKKTKGFTLVELIIVIVILGILGTIAIPQFINSTKDAANATMAADVAVMRNAINLYYHQHGSAYPGQNATDGSGPAAANAAGQAFIDQMTQYSDATGKTSAVLDRANFPYGPYLSTGVPVNPVTNSATLKVLDTTAAIAGSDVDTSAGWIFNRNTGEVRVSHADYLAY
jgi:prepilin-type N-terminal cleavage/methylation domain-containing protein